MTVRVGFVGAGGIANQHFSCLEKVPEAKIVAVCDVDAERAQRSAERFGAQAHLNASDMLEAEEETRRSGRIIINAIYKSRRFFGHGPSLFYSLSVLPSLFKV